MLMSGLAKLDAKIDEELLDIASASLQAELPNQGHQAVANTFYSLARLQHYDAQLCAAVDMHVSQKMSDFTPQVRLLILCVTTFNAPLSVPITHFTPATAQLTSLHSAASDCPPVMGAVAMANRAGLNGWSV